MKMKFRETYYRVVIFSKYRTQLLYKGKKNNRLGEEIGNDVSYESLPPYPLLRLGKKVLRIILIPE